MGISDLVLRTRYSSPSMVYLCFVVFLMIRGCAVTLKLSGDVADVMISLTRFSGDQSLLPPPSPPPLLMCAPNGECGDTTTGAAENCKGPIANASAFDPNFHDGSVIVSCLRMHYKLPEHLQKHGRYINKGTHPVKLLVGVLTLDRERRQAVRETWADQIPNLYFIIGNSFEDIRDEFYEHNDMIWYDKEEHYADLAYKVGALISILESHGIGHTHILKTDDDTYVNIPYLKDVLNSTASTYEYFGRTQPKKLPVRAPDPKRPYYDKFMINRSVYPEEFNPPYCEGMGYVVSRKFAKCLRKEIRIMRYHPFEDVATGLAAERCNISIPELNKYHEDHLFANDYKKYKRKYMNGMLMHHPLTPERLRSEQNYTKFKARSIRKKEQAKQTMAALKDEQPISIK